MNVFIDIHTDYPVVTIVDERQRANRTSAESVVAEHEVEMDAGLIERYHAARAEWVEVQRLLIEEYGMGLLKIGGAYIGRAQGRLPGRSEQTAEWIPPEQARNWGSRSGRES